MAKKGKQTNYMEGSIPFVELRGIDWYTFPTATLNVNDITASFHFHMYRDKRYPFYPEAKRTLPSHFAQRIPILLKVDSIEIKDSYVSYEEFPEYGDSSGIVYFDKVRALIRGVHNNPRQKTDIVMNASAQFMGAGNLDAHFTFPYDTTHFYKVEGTLRDMPLNRLNNMLGSAAKAKFESGVMTHLKFNFTHDNVKSRGNLVMNYENLKVLTLRENSKNEQSVSFIKTFLINTFIIKKDLREDVTDDRREGTIDYVRDDERSVFNFWWKSIFSGVKSAYGLDKLPINIGKAEKQNKKGRKSKIKTVWSRIFKGKEEKDK
jgi:hypothetical protein